MPKKLNTEEFIGQKFGCYEIISSENINGRTYFTGKCVYCGKERKTRISNFKKIKTESCPHQKEKRYCLQCGKETKNSKFCSQSCAAKYNNKKYPKKEKKFYQHYCKKCGKFLCTNRRYNSPNFCDECNPNYIDWNKITLSEAQGKRKYQISSRIRDLAKIKVRNLKRFKSCQNCGYDKHVEICHIKAIKDFPPETLISEINDLNNLAGLCPNCHWEFDNGILPFNEEWIK